MKYCLAPYLVAVSVPFLMASCGNSGDVRLTDSLDDSAWEQSSWISAADAPVITGPIGAGERAADGASWFVAEVDLSGKVESGRWMTTGLGVYQLYVNGELVGEEVLKPGFTHFRKTKISYTYDITDILRKHNVLAAQVTPGWWADKIVSTGPDGMNGRKCAFRSVLEITYTDGRKELFGTEIKFMISGCHQIIACQIHKFNHISTFCQGGQRQPLRCVTGIYQN